MQEKIAGFLIFYIEIWQKIRYNDKKGRCFLWLVIKPYCLMPIKRCWIF